MKPDIETIREWAALHAVGALDGDEAKEFARLLAESPEVRAEAATFTPALAGLAHGGATGTTLPAGLKERILQEAERRTARARLEAQLKTLVPTAESGFAFLRHANEKDWIPLPVHGAYVKLLSYDDSSGHATVLGKLDPGARYPGHRHRFSEDIFMLSGDLHIGDKTIHAMDFHHAEAGTMHGVNWSENGCVLVAVLSKEDLLEQFLAA